MENANMQIFFSCIQVCMKLNDILLDHRAHERMFLPYVVKNIQLQTKRKKIKGLFTAHSDLSTIVTAQSLAIFLDKLQSQLLNNYTLF